MHHKTLQLVGESGTAKPADSIQEFCNLVTKPVLLPDEDPDEFDQLHGNLLNQLKPSVPYEVVLAENLVHNEWEIMRHRRMRDLTYRRHFKEVAERAFTKRGSLYMGLDSGDRLELAEALTGEDSPARQKAERVLKNRKITLSDLVAHACERAAESLERHETQLQKLETRRRLLFEDYQRLTDRHKRDLVADAEILN